jgi:hypothetical protein
VITQIIFGDEYRSSSSSLCSLLHSPVTPSLLGPNMDERLYVFLILVTNKIDRQTTVLQQFLFSDKWSHLVSHTRQKGSGFANKNPTPFS